MQTRPRASILTVGNEITEGRIQDSNRELLATFLNSIGFECKFILSCRDDLSELRDSFEFFKTRADCVIVTGGLGPTSDDLTRDAIADFSQQKLALFDDQLDMLKARYRSRGREYDPSTRKQAYFPESANIIPNSLGTANGFWILQGSQIILSLPGVPAELKQMLEQELRGILDHHFKSISPSPLQIYKVFGRAESEVGKKLSRLAGADQFQFGYRASFPELEVRVRSIAGELDPEFLQQVEGAIGPDYIFAKRDYETLPAVCHDILRASKKTLALAESCTGGLASHLLSKHSGSSEYLMGAVVTYSNSSKQELIGVAPDSISSFGAVSHQVAIEMAIGARSKFQSEIGLSVTGIAGPTGGSSDKPVGTFFVGFSYQEHVLSFRYLFSHERMFVQEYAAHCMLDTIRRYLSGLPMRNDSFVRETKNA